MNLLWFQDNDPWWLTILRGLAMIAILLVFALKGVQTVPSGQAALRTRFKRVVNYRKDVWHNGRIIHRRLEPVRCEAGPVIGFPFVYGLRCETIAEQFVVLPDIVRTDPLRRLEIKLNFRVTNLKAALIDVTDYRGALNNSAASSIRRLAKLTGDNWVDDDKLYDALMEDEDFVKRYKQLGVEVLSLDIATSNLTEAAQLGLALKEAGIGQVTPALLAAMLASQGGGKAKTNGQHEDSELALSGLGDGVLDN
jgi:regulator of protease activity HflC (stomatin/prohibitin superfamily)